VQDIVFRRRPSSLWIASSIFGRERLNRGTEMLNILLMVLRALLDICCSLLKPRSSDMRRMCWSKIFSLLGVLFESPSRASSLRRVNGKRVSGPSVAPGSKKSC